MSATVASRTLSGSLIPQCPSWCTETHEVTDWELVDSGMRLYHRNAICYDIETGLSVVVVAGQYATDDGSTTEPSSGQLETEVCDWTAEDLERCGRMFLDAAAKMRELLAEEAGR